MIVEKTLFCAAEIGSPITSSNAADGGTAEHWLSRPVLRPLPVHPVSRPRGSTPRVPRSTGLWA